MGKASSVSPGDRVVIAAKDAFYAFVDGWHGVHCGYSPEGYAIVKCIRPDGEKTLFVPDDQLRVVA